MKNSISPFLALVFSAPSPSRLMRVLVYTLLLALLVTNDVGAEPSIAVVGEGLGRLLLFGVVAAIIVYITVSAIFIKLKVEAKPHQRLIKLGITSVIVGFGFVLYLEVF